MNNIGSDFEIYTIPVNKRQYIVYAPLKRIAFIANSGLINEIVEVFDGKESSYEFIKLLHDKNFFEIDKLPGDLYKTKDVIYDSVILFLSNHCNLNCIYCYANAGEHKIAKMSWETAKNAIDYVYSTIIENGRNEMTIGFHGGGEPTTNWNILVRSVDYIKLLNKRSNLNIQITGAFNGYWNPKQTRYIIENFTDISLSFDGIQIVQDNQRPTKSGGSSFQQIVKAIQNIEKGNVNYGIRMTITDFSIKYLERSIQFIVENFKPKSIQVEPVFYKGRAIRNDCRITEASDFIDNFIKAFYITERNNIGLFYSGANINILSNRFCLAPCNSLIVTPQGNLTSCFEIYSNSHPDSDKFIIGKINKDYADIDMDKLNNFINRTVENIPYCQDCFCKWHCAGDCAAKTGLDTSINRNNSERCIINQELIKFFLLYKISKNGGILWTNN